MVFDVPTRPLHRAYGMRKSNRRAVSSREKKSTTPLPAIVRFGTFDPDVGAEVDRLEAKHASADRIGARAKEDAAARRSAAKRERLEAIDRATKRKASCAAGLAHDDRIAAGNREVLVEDLGHTKRARTPRYEKLFKSRVEASPDRVQACEWYDLIWNSAHAGLLKSPDLLNGGGQSGYRNILPPGIGPHEQLSELHHRVGPEAASLLYHRIVLGFTFIGMEKQGFGRERDLRAQFVQAVDAAARFFGLKAEAKAVRLMRQALATIPSSPL